MRENQVVDLLCAWLSSKDYENIKYAHGKQQGHDIEATGPNGAPLYVECKGSTNEEGREFRWDYKYRCVTSAFFNQVRHREIKPPQTEVGIAFPDDKDYRFRMDPFRTFCERNRLRIFWVSENSVSEW